MQSFLDREMLYQTLIASFSKFHPRTFLANPIMMIVWCAAVLMLIAIPVHFLIFPESIDRFDTYIAPSWFYCWIFLWVWLTVFFANFAEALAENRSYAFAKHHRKNAQKLRVNKLLPDGRIQNVEGYSIESGDKLIVKAGEVVPCSGRVILGIASVDESALTGESSPVIRSTAPYQNKVLSGTIILSDSLIIEAIEDMSDNLLEAMECILHNKTRTTSQLEVGLWYFLLGMGAVSIMSVASVAAIGYAMGIEFSAVSLVAMLICLLPTAIVALTSTISISGIQKLFERNVLVVDNKVLEVAGDIEIVVFDKTGTLTVGHRTASAFLAASGVEQAKLLEAIELASIADKTVEGRSILTLIDDLQGLKYKGIDIKNVMPDYEEIQFSATSRISGCKIGNKRIIKGGLGAIEQHVQQYGRQIPNDVYKLVQLLGNQGVSSLIVAENGRVLGVIKLEDKLRPGIAERLDRLHEMDVRSVLVTGDNYYAARGIATAVGIEDFVCEATSQYKVKYIKDLQERSKVVAMVGDGVNDAVALAHANLGLALQGSVAESKSAANLIALNDDPMKIIEAIEIGRQINMTKGCITTFSIMSDIAKHFTVVPAIFMHFYPQLEGLNIMRLHTPHTAILSSLIFSSLLILCLLPVAIKGLPYRNMNPTQLTRKLLSIYGLGGLITPFVGIKLIDTVIWWLL